MIKQAYFSVGKDDIEEMTNRFKSDLSYYLMRQAVLDGKEKCSLSFSFDKERTKFVEVGSFLWGAICLFEGWYGQGKGLVVEHIGQGWVAGRAEDGKIYFATCEPSDLEDYLQEPDL